MLRPKLVVLGSHGRKGFLRALLGSVAESVVRRSSVPILIVPTHDRNLQAQAQAWSCRGCGYILVEGESRVTCGRCGVSPAHWNSAPRPAHGGAGRPFARAGSDVKCDTGRSSG